MRAKFYVLPHTTSVPLNGGTAREARREPAADSHHFVGAGLGGSSALSSLLSLPDTGGWRQSTNLPWFPPLVLYSDAS
jgi:hypothetical protein